jgi:hypothetical protein
VSVYLNPRWKTYCAIVELASWYLYCDLFDQARHHVEHVMEMLQSLRRSPIKPTRIQLEIVCTMYIVCMYTCLENQRTEEAISYLQRGMKSVSKVYMSSRCEKMIKKAKADLESHLGNFEEAVNEFEEIQEGTRALSSEAASETAVTENIINQSRIAKVF